MALVNVHDSRGYVVLLIFVVFMAVIAAALVRWGRLSPGWDQLTATGRAVVQLGAVGLIITAVLKSWWLTAAFGAAMILIAGITAGRRIIGDWTPWTILPILCVLPMMAAILATGLVPLKPVAVIPMLGILIGNAMTATSIAGRRMRDAMHERWGEYEARLALGYLPAKSVDLVARREAGLALIPGLDQTRTVGLVTLPGAFVGALLGGATALQAAAVQLLVLVALLVVQAAAVLVIVELLKYQRVGSWSRDGSAAVP